jgi:putative FmdB family regulatory protein
MPLLEFECPDGHRVERLVKIEDRDRQRFCSTCRKPLRRLISAPHVEADGVYSYAPNVGSPERFERQRHAMRNGTKTIPRVPEMRPEARDGQLTSRKASEGY